LNDAPDIEGSRRVMAWVENNVVAPLRVPFGPIAQRRTTTRYGHGYRPGQVRPCPWTGYCVDDDLLETIVREARDGSSPAGIVRAVEQRAETLWEAEMEYACSEDAFLEDADANGREFYENGELA
jgi:hypothetical protein